jgi:hypothetical protein
MKFRSKFATSALPCAFLGGTWSAWSQQKPQWMPGQVGLNAGILPFSRGYLVMLERAEKTKTGDQISLPLGYVCWGLHLQTVSESIRQDMALAQDLLCLVIRGD